MAWCSFALILLGICLFSTSAVSGSSDTIAREFRYDYSYEETTNAFYKLNRVRVPWYDAVTWCQEEGAELAFPTSDHEAQILINYFSKATSTVWLPFHDQYSEGVFIYTNGTSLTKLYTNWLLEEPNNDAATGEDCVSMNKEGYYNDAPCTHNYMFICKRNKDIAFKNSECLTNVPGYKLSPVTGQCYKIHLESKTWHAAFRICEAEMAGLVELNSQAEVSYLVEELKAYPDSLIIGAHSFGNIIHIDANELVSVNNYVTRSGKTIRQAGYDKWFQGQPDKGDQHCGCMGKESGMLYDLNCESNHAMFVCEKESVLSNVGQWKNK